MSKPTLDDLNDDEPAAEIAALNATVDMLQAEVGRLRAQLPAPDWMPLKLAASLCGVEYETGRAWASAGLIEARRDGGRWVVNLLSLRARHTALHLTMSAPGG